MSCEIHDDSWHCYQHEGEWFHEKKESFIGEPMPEIKPNGKIWGFNPFGKIFDILNGEE